MTGRVRDMIMNPEETGRAPRGHRRGRLLRHADLRPGAARPRQGGPRRRWRTRCAPPPARTTSSCWSRPTASARPRSSSSCPRSSGRRLTMRLHLAIALLGAALFSLAAPAAEGAYRGKIENPPPRRLRARAQPHELQAPAGAAPDPADARAGAAHALGLEGDRARQAHRLAHQGKRPRTRDRPCGRRHGRTAKTAVILINFTTDTSQPWTPDFVRQRVFTASNSSSAFYSEESYGT